MSIVQSFDCDTLRVIVLGSSALAAQYLSGVGLIILRYCCPSPKNTPSPSYTLLSVTGVFGN